MIESIGTNSFNSFIMFGRFYLIFMWIVVRFIIIFVNFWIIYVILGLILRLWISSRFKLDLYDLGQIMLFMHDYFCSLYGLLNFCLIFEILFLKSVERLEH